MAIERKYLYGGGILAAVSLGWALFGGKVAPVNPSAPAPPGTPVKPPITPVSGAPLTGYLSNAFFVAVGDLAHYFQSKGAKIGGEDLLEIFLAESSCDPRIANSIDCAGLNQICKLSSVGWTASLKEYLSLPGEEQLQYVKRYFDNVNKYPAIIDVGSLYLANFSPAFMGRPQDFHMYTKGVDRSYDLNAGVDTGNKGYIEVADMAKFVHRSSAGRAAKWNELRARFAASQVGV